MQAANRKVGVLAFSRPVIWASSHSGHVVKGDFSPWVLRIFRLPSKGIKGPGILQNYGTEHMYVSYARALGTWALGREGPPAFMNFLKSQEPGRYY